MANAVKINMSELKTITTGEVETKEIKTAEITETKTPYQKTKEKKEAFNLWLTPSQKKEWKEFFEKSDKKVTRGIIDIIDEFIKLSKRYDKDVLNISDLIMLAEK